MIDESDMKKMAYNYLAFNILGRLKVHLEVQLLTLCEL